jgi:hypothetical protein
MDFEGIDILRSVLAETSAGVTVGDTVGDGA